MTTKNHPAQGPVSLKRLHQIREHLQHDTQYSNGGNRAYIPADVLKVIDGAIASFGAEPVAWTDEEELRDAKVAGIGYLFGIDKDANKFTDPRRQIMLYRHAQPVPVVPDEMFNNIDNPYGDEDLIYEQGKIEGWNACRAAMLQAGNHTEQHLDMVVHSGDAKEKVDCRLPFDQWLSQQNEPIDVDCGCVTTEAFYHWLRVAYEAGNSPMWIGVDWAKGCDPGNSPATPDGWQLVPKEPTEEMNKAGWAAMNEHDAINPTYRAMLAAAPQQQ